MAKNKMSIRKRIGGLIGKAGGVFRKDQKAVSLWRPQARFAGSGFLGDINKFGLRKPGAVSFGHLREIARYDSITRICVNVIKKEVSQAEWSIVPEKGKNPDPAKIEKVEKLFKLINSNGENLRLLLDRVLEDLLILDAGVIEKVYNFKGELMELNVVDAATIRPIYNEQGQLDPEKAYVQVIDNKVTAEFKLNEIIYMMQNPQNDVRLFGYGLSPIESILLQVQASLEADLYNARTFSEDNIPPGMLDLGGMGDEEAEQFMMLWNATVVNHTQKMKFVWGSDKQTKFIPFQQNNKDMQFVEYIDWLSRLKLAVYGLTSIDANIVQDVNRATASVQAKLSNSRGVKTVKKLIQDYIDREILVPAGILDHHFVFDHSDSLEDKKKQAEIDKIYIETGVYTPQEVAKREGFESLEEGDPLDYSLGDPNPETNGGNGNNVADPKDTLKGNSKIRSGQYFKPLYK